MSRIWGSLYVFFCSKNSDLILKWQKMCLKLVETWSTCFTGSDLPGDHNFLKSLGPAIWVKPGILWTTYVIFKKCTPNDLIENFFKNFRYTLVFGIKLFLFEETPNTTYQPQIVSERKSFPLKHFTSSWWCLSHQYHSIFFTFSRVNRTNKNKIEVVQA